MRKKFGGYSINAVQVGRSVRGDKLIQTSTILEGNIEIGIDIDPYTWRGDWLREFIFGKGTQRQWRLINVENQYLPQSKLVKGEYVERNLVTAVWAESPSWL